ncbi:ORF66 [Helicoverpa armigera nucleopolyhedrovirus]|uniref:Ac68-like protein n=4 Tax=Alphabaculovirus helarmigerae TaxID=3047947 RepID=Q8V5T1_9ABAC
MSRIRWRILNSDRVEISPESREYAWKDLLIDLLLTSPRDNNYRTNFDKANVLNFDYNRPLVYEITNKTLLINSEFFNRALNRPRAVLSPLNITSVQIFLAFICTVLLALVVAFVFPSDNSLRDNDVLDDYIEI